MMASYPGVDKSTLPEEETSKLGRYRRTAKGERLKLLEISAEITRNLKYTQEIKIKGRFNWDDTEKGHR